MQSLGSRDSPPDFFSDKKKTESFFTQPPAGRCRACPCSRVRERATSACGREPRREPRLSVAAQHTSLEAASRARARLLSTLSRSEPRLRLAGPLAPTHLPRLRSLLLVMASDPRQPARQGPGGGAEEGRCAGRPHCRCVCAPLARPADRFYFNLQASPRSTTRTACPSRSARSATRRRWRCVRPDSEATEPLRLTPHAPQEKAAAKAAAAAGEPGK